MKRPGIRIRLLGAAFILIFATTLTLDIVGVRITKAFLHKRFNDRIAFLAKYLALNSEVGVLIGDRSGLKAFALNLLGEEDVARVTIYDNQGYSLVDQKRNVVGPLTDVKVPIILQKEREENFLFRDLQTPFGRIPHQGDEFIGEVVITYSTHGIDQIIEEITVKFIWLSMGLVLFAGLMFYIVSKPIVKEVGELAITAQHIGRGDLELRSKIGTLPETKLLSKAFNSMLDSLNQSRIALEKVNKEMIHQKSLAEIGKFSMMIAHEVKNPLGIIKSSLDMLKNEFNLSNNDLMVAYIEDEIRRLNRLIEDFLLFAKPSEPNFKTIDLNEMLRNILERFEIQKEKSPAEIKSNIPHCSARGKADLDLLTRSISNIARNACDAAGHSGWINITAFSNNNTWTAEISDNGVGIEPKHLQKIFDPFFTTRSKGTGLGLAFASQVVKAHGGRIIAENRSEGGANFRIEIPINEDAM